MKAASTDKNGVSESRNRRDNGRAERRSDVAGIGVLLFLILLGIGLRIYGLSDQSVWIDEYFTIGNLDSPSLSTFLTLVRFFCPDNMPLYMVLIYSWGQLVGPSSILLLRLLSVVMSVACLPVIYLFGQYLYGQKAGLIAAACLALSPFHIWFAQGIRPNALIELLALVSLYALVRAWRDDALGWWVLNLAANLLLVWTHPFTIFLVTAEGCFMLVFLLRRFRQTMTWGSLLTLVAVSPVLWLRHTFSSVPDAEEDFVLGIPSAKDLFIDLVGDDAVMSSDPFAFAGSTWRFLPHAVRHAMASTHSWFDWALSVFLGVCLLWLVWRVMRLLWRARRDPSRDVLSGDIPSGVLLLLVAILPLLTMLVVSYLWRPCVLPRYTSYSSFALYVIAGHAIASLNNARLRQGALGVLLVLYGYQLSMMLPGATRTDWLGAARHIKANASSQDLVLVRGTFLGWEVFRFNAGESAVPVLPAYTLQAACDKSAAFLEQSGGRASEGRDGAAVWAVVEPFIYTLPPLALFEECLCSHGLRYARRDFPSMNGVYVYRIECDPEALPAEQRQPKEVPTSLDAAGVLADMGLNHLAGKQRKAALAALRRAVDTEFPRTRLYYSLIALHLAYEGHGGLAEAAAWKAASLDPNYAFGHFVLAVALGEQGDASGAQTAFQTALDLDTMGFYPLYQELFRALYVDRNDEEAHANLTRMDRMGMFLPHVLRARAGQLRLPPALMPSAEPGA